MCTLQHLYAHMTDVRLGLQDTLGSASDKADHHTTQAKKEGQSYLDSAKDQANHLFGQGQLRPEPLNSFNTALRNVFFCCPALLALFAISSRVVLRW